MQDIQSDDNAWYGTLSSDNNGLGWMMWENTSFDLSKTLINRINPSTKSPTLRTLIKNILLSRAKSPQINSNISIDSKDNVITELDKLPYFEKNISFGEFRL